jgi:hypothetical protein
MCSNFTHFVSIRVWHQIYLSVSPLRGLHWCAVFRPVRKFAKSEYLLCHICLPLRRSVCMEQFGSHWTDFHEIRYLNVFRKYVEKIEVLLKYVKNNGYFTWRPIYIYIYIYIYRSNLLWIKNISDKICRENHNTHLAFSSFFPKMAPCIRCCGKPWQGRWSHRWPCKGRHTLSVKLSFLLGNNIPDGKTE